MSNKAQQTAAAIPALIGLADAAIQIGAKGLQWAIPKITDWVVDLFSLEDVANGSATHVKEINFPGPDGEMLKITLTVSSESLAQELKDAIRYRCEQVRCMNATESEVSTTYLLDATQFHDSKLSSGGVSLLNGIFSVSW